MLFPLSGPAIFMPAHLITSLLLVPCCSAPLQESQALQTKQRELQAALAAAQRDVTLAAGQQERITALEAEVAQAQAAATEAQQQLELAASRSGVLEKAYAAAQQVGPGLRETWWCCRGATALPTDVVPACGGQSIQQIVHLTGREPLTLALLPCIPTPLPAGVLGAADQAAGASVRPGCCTQGRARGRRPAGAHHCP